MYLSWYHWMLLVGAGIFCVHAPPGALRSRCCDGRGRMWEHGAVEWLVQEPACFSLSALLVLRPLSHTEFPVYFWPFISFPVMWVSDEFLQLYPVLYFHIGLVIFFFFSVTLAALAYCYLGTLVLNILGPLPDRWCHCGSHVKRVG